MSGKSKGVVLALLSTIALAHGYIFSKSALNQVDIWHFGFYWFAFATIWNALFIIRTRKQIKLKNIGKKSWYAIAGNTFFEVVGSIFFYVALQQMTNPAIVAFLVNLGAVFVLILGYFFLNERFKHFEYLGIAVTMAGVFLINHHTDTHISGSSITGVWLVVASALCISIALVIAKKAVNKVAPIILTSGRIVALFLLSFSILIYNGNDFIVPFSVIINTALGSLMGPFLALLLSYYALKHIEASYVSVISSTKSLFLIGLSYFVFSIQTTEYQLVGGIFTIIGIILISFGKNILRYIQNGIIKRTKAKMN